MSDDAGGQEQLFNVRETAHMADVRDLVQVLFGLQVFAVAGAVTLAVVMLALWPPRALAAAALYGSFLTVGTLVFMSIIAMTGFDSAWTQFHVIAFANDFWELDPRSDHLIQMFPEEFWFDVTILIGGVTIAQAVLISAVCGVYMVLSRPREARSAPAEPRPLPQPAIESRPRLGPPDPRHYVH